VPNSLRRDACRRTATQVPIVHAGARIDPEIALSQYAIEAIGIPARRPERRIRSDDIVNCIAWKPPIRKL
jgi:hypothetical protein